MKKQATAYKSAVNEASAYISDKTAKSLLDSAFEQWEGNKLYDVVGKVVVFDGIKYRIVQPHTSQSNWLPSNTPSLYDSFTLVDDGRRKSGGAMGAAHRRS